MSRTPIVLDPPPPAWLQDEEGVRGWQADGGFILDDSTDWIDDLLRDPDPEPDELEPPAS